jgi:signal transduction histidine kinase
MKLRHKIFISILIVSPTTLIISSYDLINRSHLDNINREQERSLNDFELIRTALENGISFNSATDQSLALLFSRYDDYYQQKGIRLMLFQDGTPIYNQFTAIRQNTYDSLLAVASGTKKVQIFSEAKQHYILVSGKMSKGNYCLVYARSINSLYTARSRSIYFSSLLAAGLIILLGFLSYLYSRWLTKPIEQLNRGANAVSKGDYSVRMNVTKDEFNQLGTAFNQMASAVENRTAQLEDRARELQVFIDDLSHEMNTPLTSIQGYSEFLISANVRRRKNKRPPLPFVPKRNE